ncbi:DNA-binding protein modulo [Bactrocera dorsalis]|uniref:DNA-binding protein modulo n=1 Tax=Bactrocera dorsalis TaxID=27457 RepID=A0A6I9VL41_BACDO|nr:DNA-binding protein modulo [Bactrocera dorsalis]
MKQRKSNVGVKSSLNGVKNDSIVKKQKKNEVSTPAKGTPARNNQKKLGKTPVKEVPPKKVEVEEEEESEVEEDSGADVAEDVVNEGEDSEAEDEDEDEDNDDGDDDDESEEEDENIEGLVENEAEEDDEAEDDSEEDDDEEPTEVPIEKRASESPAKAKSKKPKSSDETGVQKIKTGAPPKSFPKEQVLIVKNLPKNYKQIELVEIFAKYGTIDTIYNIHGPASCVAYVAYTSPEDAEAAQEATDKIAKVKGAVLKVNIQTPNPKKLKKAEEFEERKKKFEENRDRTIYIKNLKDGTTEDQIKSHFANCGAVESVKIYTKNGYTSTCFVCFEDKSAVPSAFKLHNSILNESNIWVNQVHEHEMVKDPKRTIILRNGSNLPNIELSKLEAIFSKCGEIEVENTCIFCTKNVLAFVTFKDEKAAKKALKLNGTSAQDIDLEIEEYKVITPKYKTTVFIQNIRPGVTEEEIRELFASTGPIENVMIIGNFATVRFADTDGFCKAFLLNESVLRGQVIFLEPYSEKKRRNHHNAPFNRKRPAGFQFKGFAKRSKPN